MYEHSESMTMAGRAMSCTTTEAWCAFVAVALGIVVAMKMIVYDHRDKAVGKQGGCAAGGSMGSDDPLDALLYRLADRAAPTVRERWGWTPNQVTLLNLVVFRTVPTVLAYVGVVRNSVGLIYLGAPLAIFGSFLDNLDGLLARRYKLFSPFGKIFDEAVDVWQIGLGLVQFYLMVRVLELTLLQTALCWVPLFGPCFLGAFHHHRPDLVYWLHRAAPFVGTTSGPVLTYIGMTIMTHVVARHVHQA